MKAEDYLLGMKPHRLAAALCIAGFFLRILLSDPLLLSFGIHYSGDTEGAWYEKIHPGSYLIFLSLLVLLLDHAMPFRQALDAWRRASAFVWMLFVNLLCILYWVARNPVGVGALIDTHLVAAICAIVLLYVPRSYARFAVYAFVALAAVNSVIGIGESFWRVRLFDYSSDWTVLKEHYFRASALLGHPLNNAMFTSIALFAALALRLPASAKALLTGVYLVSLVAFGGRAGLLFSLLGLVPAGVMAARNFLHGKKKTMTRILLLLTAAAGAAFLLAGGLYVVIHSPIGERILAMDSFNDVSAESRWAALRVFDYMTPEEILFGVPADRVIGITQHMGTQLPISDIENPWLLMFMFLGVVLFPVWFLSTLVFLRQLFRLSPPMLKAGMLVYLLIISTSNSLGRKDVTYSTLVAVVLCAANALADAKQASKGKSGS